jgi:hypothetical protein
MSPAAAVEQKRVIDSITLSVNFIFLTPLFVFEIDAEVHRD